MTIRTKQFPVHFSGFASLLCYATALWNRRRSFLVARRFLRIPSPADGAWRCLHVPAPSPAGKTRDSPGSLLARERGSPGQRAGLRVTGSIRGGVEGGSERRDRPRAERSQRAAGKGGSARAERLGRSLAPGARCRWQLGGAAAPAAGGTRVWRPLQPRGALFRRRSRLWTRESPKRKAAVRGPVSRPPLPLSLRYFSQGGLSRKGCE